MKKNGLQSFVITFMSLTVLLGGCRLWDKNEEAPFESGSNEYINDWIYSNLELYYYWNTDLPSPNITDESPQDYFYGLLSSQDRFSWIQPNFRELLNSLQGINKEAGYELILYRNPDDASLVIGQIAYIKKDSPADLVGLRRGDTFDKVNDTPLTIENYQTLLEATENTHSLAISRYNYQSQIFQPLGTISLTPIEFAENPNFLDSIYTVNGKKIGYYVYNLFATGPDAGSNLYNNEMDEIFQNFKSNGIDHLILDLRYNSGGAESATINLASLIGANINDQSIFVKRDYNEGLEAAFIQQYGEDFLNKKFVQKAQNLGNNLQSPQFTVISSKRTASASELLINGLNPFMEVFLIGDTTVGKNVGSTSLYEEQNSQNTWGMQPIITKSFNSLSKSDYDRGFIPDIVSTDNSLIKKQLGDVEEKLLHEALQFITGVEIPTSQSTRSLKQVKMNDLGSSLDKKRSFGIYNIEMNLP